jgi:cysteine dioxygenase
MQRDIRSSTAALGTAATDEREGLDLRGLVAAIKGLDEVPSLETLYSWLGGFCADWAQLGSYVSFKPGTYARHLIVRGKYAEALLLCWRPGQRTPIHDHNGSIGAVRVCRGILWETIFHQDEDGKLRYESARQWTLSETTGAEVPDIHQLGNPDVSGEDLISLHIYAPPLGVLNTYKVGTTEVGHYSPNDFTDGAGI